MRLLVGSEGIGHQGDEGQGEKGVHRRLRLVEEKAQSREKRRNEGEDEGTTGIAARDPNPG